jgi:hypothetical protein
MINYIFSAMVFLPKYQKFPPEGLTISFTLKIAARDDLLRAGKIFRRAGATPVRQQEPGRREAPGAGFSPAGRLSRQADFSWFSFPPCSI